jgi:dipeptidyl aminopeptidase/acylaminoacyl peptidase
VPWDKLMVQNSIFALNSRAPALIIQGGADDIVKPQVTTMFVRGACQAGASVQYVTLKGVGHGGALEEGRVQAVNWVAGRLAGQPPHSNCR